MWLADIVDSREGNYSGWVWDMVHWRVVGIVMKNLVEDIVNLNLD